jgi:hypothetical protein
MFTVEPMFPGGRLSAKTAGNSTRSFTALALSLLLAGAAHATLGQAADSVARDIDAMRGTSVTRSAAGEVVVHEITTGEGTQVREYVSPTGLVFATSWVGRALPDLKLLLGAHYKTYLAQAGGSAGNAKVFSLAGDDLVLRVAKLPRGFAGSAQLTKSLPPNLGAGELR